MQNIVARHIRFIAAGSLTSAIVALAFVPFNMGGCSGANLNITDLVQGGGKMLGGLTMSEKEEPAIGQSVALQATNRYPIYPDQNLNRYVTLVGRTVGAASSMPNLKWYFAVLDTDQVNAFSGPHGYVFITRGALARMHDESELAGVLAHEIGHVCAHHGLNAVKNANFTQGALTAAKGADKHVAEFGSAADVATDAIINKGFNQPQEEEADADAVKFLAAAGYDPNGFLRFLQRIQHEQAGGGNPFGTHPGTAERAQKVADQIARAGTGGKGATSPERFAQFAIAR